MIKDGLVLKVRWSQLGWATNVYDSETQMFFNGDDQMDGVRYKSMEQLKETLEVYIKEKDIFEYKIEEKVEEAQMRKIDEIAKTMTKEEFLKGLTGGKDYAILVVNGEEYYCPGNLGLKESDDCDCSCEECWRKALDGVKFKEKEEKVVTVAPTFEEVEKSGIKNIELVMEHRIEEAIKNGEDLINLNCYSTNEILLNEQQIRQLIEWLSKVISYIDSVKAKDNEVVVSEEKKVLNKEELENLVGITIIEK